jgi:hypothetical protein
VGQLATNSKYVPQKLDGMEDLFELNRQIVEAKFGASSSRMREAAGRIPVCIAACVPTAEKLCDLLSGHTPHVEVVTRQTVLNQLYFETMRLLSREAMLGKVSSLLLSSLTLSQAHVIAGLTNGQIRHLSVQKGIDYLAIDEAALKSSELQGIAYLHSLASYQAPIQSWADDANSTNRACSTLPAAAREGDLRWTWAINEVGAGLVKHRLKRKVIENLTICNPKQIKQLYRDIHDEHPPSGIVQDCKPSFFVDANNNNQHNGRSWNIMGSILLGEIHHLCNTVHRSPNKGWLLLHAYESYLNRVRPLADEGIEIMTINHAYRLMVMSSLDIHEYRKLDRHRCQSCQTTILVLHDREPDDQPCPLCTPMSRGRGHWRSIPPEKRTG